MLIRLWAILAIALQPMLSAGIDPICARCPSGNRMAACVADEAPSCCGEPDSDPCGGGACGDRKPEPCNPCGPCEPTLENAGCILRVALCRVACEQPPQTPLREKAPELSRLTAFTLPEPFTPDWPRALRDRPSVQFGAPAPALAVRQRLALKCSWLI